MKKIKTFEAACKAVGIDPKSITAAFVGMDKELAKPLLAHAKLVIIAQALNEGWKPDWNNDDEHKYYLWFDMEKTSSNKTGFSLYYVTCYYAYSTVGSRLCFKSREIAEYAAKIFLPLYKQYFKD